MAKVLLFGSLRDVAGWRERDIDVVSLQALKALLAGEDVTLGEALAGKGVQVAVDQVIVRGEVVLGPRTEVAFLPPMSGG
jgi:sulfur-carrier protein